MTAINTLVWRPYQGAGVKGSFISQVVLDAAIDTVWQIPIISKYSNQTLVADGVIINNEGNNALVSLQAGPLLTTVSPYAREPVSLDHSVTTEVLFQIVTGVVILTFYIGTPPINPVQYNYQGAAASVVANLTPLTDSLNANVPFGTAPVDGPSVQQGFNGSWFASATMTLHSGGVADNLFVDLTDGVTLIDTTVFHASAGSSFFTVSVSGFIVNPVGDIRITCYTNSFTTPCQMIAKASGSQLLSRACTLTVFRVAP